VAVNAARAAAVLSAILAAVTLVKLRRDVVGNSEATVRAAVETRLHECPLPDDHAGPDFPAHVNFWLLDHDAREWFRRR
jgi:hypothetical protein